MENKQKNKKINPAAASEMANDQLGENASGHGKQNEVYKAEHTSKTKKR